ncbi:MAG: hypothetical protein COU63_04645 [Candidatus Pacebacteria bacterium CG10_big_fil_rev_8_21_14_0_10_36_11]|nr:hypothetical protein [Candidatus Pacearchaeota archaeon]OIP74002.1 MAG: hypothetical protein AUK08_01970 [Candidatus Pacebacteria bacterium CG2_30_36_39]PIR64358.1 MAG: hypothetical protein COU63_04645 [Candidatus Pacebacteria bacterium CG10_big_fil_rev_8_21_14_0_10_36_11]PJC42492.1 MAG: hypothetical protein CO040_04185 [Candidatus Pacebacteria bacterium CG_4_9_14_0_2_um_filter_36_8]
MKKQTINQIYDQYFIPPGLRNHMYLVAAVGKYICDAWIGPEINKNNIISALLLHDLGNLIKFDLSENAVVLDKALLDKFWLRKQVEIKTKYGKNAHKATVTMVKEIGVNKKIIKLVKSMDATNLEQSTQASWEEQICEYADLRVIPTGISSLQDRLVDIQSRYKHRSKSWADENLFVLNQKFGVILEKNLQQNANVDITNISSEKISTYLVELSHYQIVIEP